VFVRFVGGHIDRRTHKRHGIFDAAGTAMDVLELESYEVERLRSVLDWFNAHLPVPTTLTRLQICWFKASAREHLARAREIQHILDANGVLIEMLTTRRPGYVVYEDEFQVAAHPFVRTPA